MCPWRDLQDKLARKSKTRKFAVVSRIPTVDSTYYPIPYYAALFKGKWYNIKQLIGIAKEAKLRNSAPIKYHIEVGAKYWESMMAENRIIAGFDFHASKLYVAPYLSIGTRSNQGGKNIRILMGFGYEF